MISSLLRNFNGYPNIVTMVTDDSLLEITTAGYLESPAVLDSIAALQHSTFQWQDTDYVLVAYDGGMGWFTHNAATNSLVAAPAAGGLAPTLSNGAVFVGNASNVATGVPVSGDASMDNTGALTIASGAVTLNKLAPALQPAAVIKFVGQHTTAGGGAAEAITVTGAVAATDRAFVQVVNPGTNLVTVLSAVVSADTLTVTFSADPGTDAIINYQLVRATA